MKAFVAQAVLKQALDRLAPLIKPSPVPVLEQVLLEAGGSRLRLTGGGAEFALVLDVPATVEEPGALTLPAAALRDLVRAFPDGPLTLGSTGVHGYVAAGASRAELAGIAASEYPTPPAAGDTGIDVSADALVALIERTAFAAALEEGAPGGINGVLLRVRDGQLLAYATDRFRLAKATLALGDATAAATDVIVLPKVLDALRRMADDGDTVRLGAEPGQSYRLWARAARAQLVATALEGPFPNCERVLPQQPRTVIVVPRQALMDELGRLLVLANAQTHRVELDLNGGTLRCHATRQDRGSIRGEVSAARECGDAFTIAINGRYLQEILHRIPSAQVELGCSGDALPMRVCPRGGLAAAEGLTFALMPLRAAE